jgi:4-carboxymuconolactone decarboxylase
MNSTTQGNRFMKVVLALATSTVMAAAFAPVAVAQAPAARDRALATAQQALSPRQQAIAPIAASMAVGDMPQLNAALNQGLDAGLTVSEVKEILGQLYAYAGFPRSLNALGEMLKVMEARRQRGIQDAPGRDPSAPIPTGRELLALGTANQTRLAGAPVAGPLFEFSPQMDEYLKNHLFGAIFARDNLDWQSRELATVGALAAMPGVESQLQSHVQFSMNVGLTPAQMRQLGEVLGQRGQPEAARRVQAAIDRQLANSRTNAPAR